VRDICLGGVMRQVFNQFPWIAPKEFEIVRKLYYKYGRLHRIMKNSIIKCGGECNKLFFLKKGLCMYVVNYERETPRVLSLIPPDRAMGDMTCLSGEIVNVTTLAKRDSEVLVIPPDVLDKAMREDYELVKAVMKTTISKQECYLEGMIANFTLNNEDRLKVLIKSMFEAEGIEPDEWSPLPIKLNNSELGMVTNASRVTVSRIMSRWAEAGLVRKEKNETLISLKLFDGVYDWHDNLS